MQCPSCCKEGAKYVEPRRREGIAPDRHPIPRDNFQAKCNKCNWQGEIR